MKPSFALNLTDEGVTLLHRTARGWLDVGHADFSDPDLPAALDYLRSTALGLSPKGLATKLVIPNSQILYTDVDLQGAGPDGHRALIEAALVGRTPYDVADLAFDWQVDGRVAHVAVVSRETLAEAEGFATEHRFNPLSFVAIPDASGRHGYAGEPFFGASSLAPALLPKNQPVERDDDAISVITREMPKDTARPATAAIDDAALLTDAPEDITPEPVADPVGEADVWAAPEPFADLAPEADSAPAAPVMAEPTFAPEPYSEPDVGQTVPEAPFASFEDQPFDAPEPDYSDDFAPEAERELTLADPAPEPEYFAYVASEPDLEPELEPELESELEPAAQDASGWPFEATPEPVARTPDPQPEIAPAPAPAPAPAFTTAPADSRPPAFAMNPAPRGAAESTFTAPKATRPASQPVASQPVASQPVASQPDAYEAPMAIDVSDGDDTQSDVADPMEDAPKPALMPSMADAFRDDARLDDVPPLSSAAMLAFASRRSPDMPPVLRGAGVADAGLRDSGPGPNAVPTFVVAPLTSAAPGTGSARAPVIKPTVDRPAGARPAPKFSYDDAVPPPPRMPGDPPMAKASVMGKAGKGLRNLGAIVSAKPTLAKGAKKPIAGSGLSPSALAVDAPIQATALRPTPTSTARPPQTLVKPDALAKGLTSRGVPQRGKPRYLGLILTGVLLLLLAVVAAWSSYYLTQRDTTDPTAVATLDTPALIDPAPLGTAPEAAAIAAPDAVVPAVATTATPETTAATEPAPQTGVESAAAGDALAAPPTQDEIFLAAMDAPPALGDPLILSPPAAAGDALPAPQMPPPPFGTVYQFDENGLIQPMPGGILTPEGVNLVAGPPPRLPPQRPATIEAAARALNPVAPAVAATEAAPAPSQAALTPALTFAADPALSDARPRLRPDGLVPAAPATAPATPGAADDAALAPAGDSGFTSLRPRTRPAAILAAGEAARVASQSASLAVQAAAEAVIVEASASASISPQAVSVSRVPAPRPRNLSRAVEAAVAAATRQPEVTVAAASTAAPAEAPKAGTHEEADDEPETASAAPRIPTKANVAKQATFVNAINLSKVNLIGVYGSQSRRYALIRQANGRYKKVVVGDSIDGGRIQAITANEVRYQKGGRLIALAMPQG